MFRGLSKIVFAFAFNAFSALGHIKQIPFQLDYYLCSHEERSANPCGFERGQTCASLPSLASLLLAHGDRPIRTRIGRRPFTTNHNSWRSVASRLTNQEQALIAREVVGSIARAPQPLCAALETTKPLNQLVQKSSSLSQQRLIFVGGKGGVGKTTTSSSLAVHLSDSGLNTLIVSTDPAHSLSDALMQDVSGGKPVPVQDCPNLLAMEVDTDEAVARFRKAVGGFRASDLGLGGVAEEALSKLGLDEFADILDNTPPGLDELLALAETLAAVRGSGQDDAGVGNQALAQQRVDRIVFDTAPTGHTLRLLAFPDFLNKLLEKIIALKSRIGGALSLLGGLLGGVDPAAKLNAAVVRLERWQSRVSELQRLLKDPDVTDFVIVSIPSRLSVAECARLLSALAEQNVAVNHLVVNQIVDSNVKNDFFQRVAAEQMRSLEQVDHGKSPLSSLKLSRVPFFDIEIRGVYPLKYYAQEAYNGDDWNDLFEDSKDRFILVGGKGGVGKTTSSSALAVELADRGYNTLIVSTDPAHSLGDALDVDLSSGQVKRIDGPESASLYAIEVKVDEAIAEFKRLVSGLSDNENGGTASLGLADFADVFDAVPPGVDELIALAKIVALARADSYGLHFDRVVIDTAPTGHTLRLLTFPDFLDRFIDRLLMLRDRFQGAASLLSGASSLLGNVFASGGSANKPANSNRDDEEPPTVVKLKEFQNQMRDLDTLLKDEKMSEFIIVSIPTFLSITEAERLFVSLQKQGIAVRRGILNRLISADAKESYIAQLAKGQQECLEELSQLAKRADTSITKVPYYDSELRATYGLRAMGLALFGDTADER